MLGVLIVGLDGAGKSTMLYKLKVDKIVTTTPIVGFSVETVAYNNIAYTSWDINIRNKTIRSFWRAYYENARCIVFVVEINDRDRIDEARDELHSLL